jgi:predicted RNA-binding Zn-ribbon protein involved in translation (DUF1610 family)
MTNEILCPKCGSNQITANKKGYSGKKAAAGVLLTGGVGLLAGTIGSHKIITCLACGHVFKPGDKNPLTNQIPQKQRSKSFWQTAKILWFVMLVIFALLSAFAIRERAWGILFFCALVCFICFVGMTGAKSEIAKFDKR